MSTPHNAVLGSRHDLYKVSRALISVSDKRGCVELAHSLSKLKVEILSTGGTAKLLRNAGINVIDVSDYTLSPEMLDGLWLPFWFWMIYNLCF